MDENMNMQIILEAVDQSQEAFKGIDDALNAVQKLADDLSKAFDSFAQSINKDMGQASASIETLSKPIEDQASKLSTAFDEPAKQAQSQLESISKGLDEITKVVDKQASDVATAFDDPAKKAEESLKVVADGLNNIQEEAQKQAEDVVKAFGEAATKSEEELKKITMPNVSTTTNGEGGHGKGGMFGMQGQMDTMYAAMAVGVPAAGMTAGLGDSIDQFAQFDQSMRLVNQEMGLSEDKFRSLEQSVMNLSNTTGISSNELASGLYNVVASGVTNTSDALNMLQVAAQGAKAGNTDLGTATQALNAVMGAYGVNASQAQQIMDTMFVAVNNGQMHFGDLAKSVGASATSAATAGVSYTELAAAQATLTNVGKNAESASQNLNSLIMGMIAPTSEAQKEASKLGIQWDAQALKAHGLSYMINEAITATHGNSEELKKLVPNQRAYMAVLALGENAHKQYTDTLNKMKDAHGATAAAMEQYDKGAGDQIEKMKQSITNAGIALGTALAPSIERVTTAVSNLAQWFSSLSPSTQKTIADIAVFTAGLLLATAGIFSTISAIGGFLSGVKTISTTFSIFKEGTKDLTSFGKMVTGLGKVFTSFGKMAVSAIRTVGIALMENPMILIIAAIVAAVAFAAYEIYTHWGQIKTFLIDTWNTIKTTASTVWNAITSFFSGIWNGVTSFFTTAWNGIKTTASTVWNAIVDGIKAVWNAFSSWVIASALAPFQFIVQAFEWLYNHNYYFKDLVDFIKNAWNTIKQDASDIWNGIKQFFANIWNDIKQAAESYWNTEVQFYKTLWNGIVQAANTIWTPIAKFFSDMWNGIKKFAEGLWNDEVKFYTTLWNSIVKLADAVWTPIKDFFSGIWNDVSTVASTVWGSIQNTMSGLWNGIVTDAENIFNGLGKWFEGLWQQAEQWGSNLIHMVAQGIANAAHEVEDAVKNVAGKVASFLGFHSPTKEGPGSDADTWAPNFVKMFAGGIANGANRIAQAANTMISPLGASVNGTMSHSIVAGGVGGNGQIVFAPTIHVSGNVTRNEQELAKIVSRELYKQAKSLGKF